MSVLFDPILGRLRSGDIASDVSMADVGSLFTAETVEAALAELGGINVRALWYVSIASGTAGTLSPPEGGTLVLNQWPDAADCLTTNLGSDGTPNWTTPHTSGAVAVASALNVVGNWTLTGTPSAYPIAIIYCYDIPITKLDRTKCISETLIGGSGGVGNVVGPASAADGNFAGFDGTTGNLIKDSGKGPGSFLPVSAAVTDLSMSFAAHTLLACVSASDQRSAIGAAAAGAAPTAHAASHISGDPIQSATASQAGLATAAQITKLDSLGETGAAIHAATALTTLVDADELGLWGSVAGAIRKITFSNLKAALATTKAAVDAVLHAATAHSYTGADKIVANVGSDLSAFTLLSTLDNAATDVSPNGASLTPSNVTYTTDVPATLSGVTKSAVFNGSNALISMDRILVTAGDINRPMTIETFVKFGSKTGYQPIMQHTSNAAAQSAGDFVFFYYGGDNSLRFYRFTGSGSNDKIVVHSWNPTIGVWYHIQATWKSNGDCFISVNGTGVTYTPSSTSGTFGTGSQYLIGAFGDGSRANLSLSNLAVRDNVSVWTSNFTPPTGRYDTTVVQEISCLAAGRAWLAAASYTAMTALLDVATTSLKGLLSATDKTKLDGVASGATANAVATAAEITTGTDTAKYICPDALAGSVAMGRRVISVIAVDSATDVSAADGKAFFAIPEMMTGMNLVRAQAIVNTAGTTNATTVDIYNVTDAVDMLSGAISIASAGTVGTVGTIDITHDDVATNDVLRIDVTTASTTKPKGLLVILEFALP